MRVYYTNEFQDDLRNARNYIIKKFKNDIAADRLANDTIAATERQANLLEIATSRPYFDRGDITFYNINIRGYVVVYYLDNNYLIAAALFHSRQDIRHHLIDYVKPSTLR